MTTDSPFPPLHPAPLGCPVGQPRDRDGIQMLPALCSGDQEALDPSGLGRCTTPIQSHVPERKRPLKT